MCSIARLLLKSRLNAIVVYVIARVARLAQSVEHETLNLRVVGSSPTLGVAIDF